MTHDEEIIDLEPYEETDEDFEDRPSKINRWIRLLLPVLTIPWLIVFFIATTIRPYDEDGNPRRMGTHMQIGIGDQKLPDCNFKEIAGVPCPSCGMTTSFCLLIRADVWNSMKANFAGTVLASFGLLFIPWALASAFLGRFVFIRSLEMVVFRLAIIFLVLLFGRWVCVLIWELAMKP